MDAVAIVSCIASALGVGAIVSGFLNRKLAKAAQKAEEDERARQHETVLILKGVKASGALSYATAMAIKRGHANGEVEKGVEAYEEWEKDIDTFLVEEAAKK